MNEWIKEWINNQISNAPTSSVSWARQIQISSVLMDHILVMSNRNMEIVDR